VTAVTAQPSAADHKGMGLFMKPYAAVGEVTTGFDVTETAEV